MNRHAEDQLDLARGVPGSGRAAVQRHARAKWLAIDPGHAEMAVPIGANVRQHRHAHGGLIAFLADAAVTFAAGSVGGERVRTVDLTINSLRVARGRELVARADVLHRGSRLIVARCDLFDRQEHGEIRCAAAQGTVTAP